MLYFVGVPSSLKSHKHDSPLFNHLIQTRNKFVVKMTTNGKIAVIQSSIFPNCFSHYEHIYQWRSVTKNPVIALLFSRMFSNEFENKMLIFARYLNTGRRKNDAMSQANRKTDSHFVCFCLCVQAELLTVKWPCN